MKRPEDLNPWFYPVTIGGVDVPCGVDSEGRDADRPGWQLVVRQNLRRMILVGELTKRVDLRGARILDVACNCAFWSSIYLSGYGAASVVGIEGRALYIEQARMLYADLGILGRAEFIHGNVLEVDYAALGTFDFVLCAGLLYHITDHAGLLGRLAATGAKHLLLDTRLAGAPTVHAEPRDLHFNALDGFAMAMTPSLGSLQSILGALGYSSLPLPVPFQYVAGMGSGDNYAAGRRVALLCRAETGAES